MYDEIASKYHLPKSTVRDIIITGLKTSNVVNKCRSRKRIFSKQGGRKKTRIAQNKLRVNKNKIK